MKVSPTVIKAMLEAMEVAGYDVTLGPDVERRSKTMPVAAYFGVGLVAALLTPTLVLGGDRITGRAFATRSEVIAQQGMAATSQPLATQIALDILKKGGSAIDAAIAANAALGLMEPVGSGIGGDLFAIVWDAKTQKLYGLNASGRSPYGLSREHFLEKGLKQIPNFGPLPVSVPGCVDGWFELHRRFGKLPMKDILAPAIGYARQGFPVSELIAHYWRTFPASPRRFCRRATLRRRARCFAILPWPEHWSASPRTGETCSTRASWRR